MFESCLASVHEVFSQSCWHQTVKSEKEKPRALMVVTQLNYYNVLNCWLLIKHKWATPLALGAAFFIFYLCVTQKDVMFQQWPAMWSNRVCTVLLVLEFSSTSNVVACKVLFNASWLSNTEHTGDLHKAIFVLCNN